MKKYIFVAKKLSVIHYKVFNDTFSLFGINFLNRFYLFCLNSKYCKINYRISKENKIIYYWIAVKNLKEFYKHFLYSHLHIIVFFFLINIFNFKLCKKFFLFFLSFCFDLSKFKFNSNSMLLYLYVDKKYRLKNIGSTCIKIIDKYFKKNRIKNYALNIISHTQRLKFFYQKNKFKYMGSLKYHKFII